MSSEKSPTVPLRDRLLMVALIAAIRTARFEPREYEGMASPRMVAAIHDSVFLTSRICDCVEKRCPEWFGAR